MSTYITCTLCKQTVKGWYRNPHPFTWWCKCDEEINGRTEEKPYANTVARSYGKDFDFGSLDPSVFKKVDYRNDIPTWPSYLVRHNQKAFIEADSCPVYTGSAQTIFEGDHHVSKWESLVSRLDAVINATKRLHEGINLIRDGKQNTQVQLDQRK